MAHAPRAAAAIAPGPARAHDRAHARARRSIMLLVGALELALALVHLL
ncbi:MAG TPA: hypothetical protein VN770_05835 [Gaiellaceae bacterium]|nr:hypothetical protein [Gaiellaceae bacterium]